jgi:hypothetical protein
MECGTIMLQCMPRKNGGCAVLDSLESCFSIAMAKWQYILPISLAPAGSPASIKEWQSG